jgi:hypothetical protein
MTVASVCESGSADLTLYLPRGSADCLADSAAKESVARARLDRKPCSREAPRPATARRGRVGRWPLFAVSILLILCLREGANGPRISMDAPPCAVSEKLGTSVDFVPSSADATRLALRAGKLTFTLHVAGDFADSAFT